MTSDEAKRAFLRWRDVEDPCPGCDGSGVRLYPSTSTWRGGMGGSMMTSDVCDQCWGSGDAHKHWTDLRKLHHTEEQRAAERALSLLVGRAGANLLTCKPAVIALVAELDRFADQPRKQRPDWFREICRALARTIQGGVRADETASGKDGEHVVR